jgi:hypothetical protein
MNLRRRTGPTRTNWVTAGAAAVVVGATAALLATMPPSAEPDAPVARASAQPVTRTVLACPPGFGDAILKVAVAGALSGQEEPEGEVEVDLMQTGAEPRHVSLERGDVRLTKLQEPSGVILRGTGDAAPGLLAVRGERGTSTLTGGGCLAPQPVWWFAGAGAGVDHSSVLFLTNADEGPAVVDVRLHGATGSVDDAGTRGLTLASGETVRLSLQELAPGSRELAVEVRASRGRVVAHVVDSLRDSGRQGREWLPAGVPPADDVVLPGVPSGADRTQLLVANPGDEQALVDLEVLTTDGAFVPLGAEQVSVDPGSVATVDLTEELKGRAAAVRLRGSVPVTGAVRSWSSGDVAYAGTAASLEAPVGVLVVGDRSEVHVVGGDAPAVLELVLLAADGREVLRRGVTAPPSALVRAQVPGSAAYAVLMPGSGGGFAASTHAGPGIASQPLGVLPTTQLRPTVRPYAGQAAD